MRPLVSIVMPIYNAMPYLTQALDSALGQTLKEIEIVCVNDGSKDNSLDVIREYAGRDPRIVIIDGPNGGYGKAMNRGIQSAQGEYVGILEPDDYILPTMYEKLYARAKKDDLDFVRSDFYSFVTDSNGKDELKLEKISPWEEYYGPTLNPQEDIRLFNIKMENWTGIYKSSFLSVNSIRFNESPGAAFQDNGFWFQTYCLATKIAFLDEPFYCYRNDNASSSINQKDKVFVMLDEYSWIRKWLVSHPDLCKKYMAIYQYKKIHNCEFAFSRLSDEYQLPFLQRYAEEYRLAFKNNEIDPNLFYFDEWERTKQIMRDPEGFLEQYRSEKKNQDACEAEKRARQEARESGKLAQVKYYLKKEGLGKTVKRLIGYLRRHFN